MSALDLPLHPRKVLLVRLSSLGDVVCAMPLAMGLRRRYPRARLLWAVEPDAAPLVEGHGSGAEAVIVPRTGSLGVRGRAVIDLRSLRPDLVVDAQGNAKSGTVSRIAARGAPIVGFSRRDVREWSNLAFTTIKAPDSGETHAVRRNLGLLHALGAEVPGGDPDYGLSPRPEEIEAGQEVLRRDGIPVDKPLVLIHIGKLRDIRTWTVEGIAELADGMMRRGYAVALEGPDPRRPADAVRTFGGLFARGVADLTGGVPLRTLLGLLGLLGAERRERGLAHVLVSPDTLLPHLAAAVGLPVVLLAGPQDPDRTGPLGGTTRVVRAWKGLPCAPCRRRRCHYEEPRACMRRIAPETVAAAVEAIGQGSR